MEIGLIFKDDENYSKCAQWCNENNAYIEEIAPLDDGTRQFKIVAIPTPTDDELALAQAEQELSETESQINDIKDRLLYAILLDDNETVEQLKSEYKELVNE